MSPTTKYRAVTATLILAFFCQFSSAQTHQQAPPQEIPLRINVKHKSIQDVSAIGTRKIGKKGLGNWYSLETEIRLGQEYSRQLDTKLKLSHDPLVTSYINEVGQKLVRNSDAEVPFVIKVMDDPGSVNPFSLPGGFLYVPTGLILTADNESELAGMMAHEIAHVTAHHATREMTRSNMINLASNFLVLITGPLGYAARTAAGIGLPLAFSKFSRGFESEADYLGLQYLYNAGYDPQSYIAFLERASRTKTKPSRLAKAFSGYPATPRRLENARKEIVTILSPRDKYVVTTSEFDDVKAYLEGPDAKLKLNPKKHTKLMLRHVTHSPAQEAKPTT